MVSIFKGGVYNLTYQNCGATNSWRNNETWIAKRMIYITSKLNEALASIFLH